MRTTPTNPFAAIRVPGTASPTPTATPAGRAAPLHLGEPMDFSFDLSYLTLGDPMDFSFDLQ